MAGWRPTTVFHLIYSESSILVESHIIDILRGLRTGDLGDLSPSQFRRVSELQWETVKEENEITGDFSEWQDSASEMLVAELDGGGVSQKIGQLGFVLRKADDLRLRTIQSVVELLTPQQAVEFLIAAAELQFGIRAWGVNHDRTSIREY
uniref:DOG1 domain-containing protein n=1 Tax=Cannabis sativa TaxID=3483 RepID=A0A803QGX7_CANSA